MADGEDGGDAGAGGAGGANVANLGLGLSSDDAEAHVSSFTGKVVGLGEASVTMGEQMDSGAAQATTAIRTMTEQGESLASTFREGFDTINRGVDALGISFGFFAGAEAVRGVLDVSSRFEELGAVMNRVGANAGNSVGYIKQQETAVEGLGVGAETARQALVRMMQGQIDLSKATQLTTASQNFAVASGLDLDTAEQDLVRAIASGNSFILKRAGLNVDWKRGENEVADAVHANGRALTTSEEEQARYISVIDATVAVNGAWDASMQTPAGSMRRLGIEAQELKVRLGEAVQPEFTAALHGVGEAMTFASDHTDLMVAAATALGVRGIAPLVARFGAAASAQAASTLAMVAGRTETVISTAADVAAAKAAMEDAQATLILAKARASNAADAGVSAAATAQITAAQFRQAAASAAVTDAIEAQRAAFGGAQPGFVELTTAEGKLTQAAIAVALAHERQAIATTQAAIAASKATPEYLAEAAAERGVAAASTVMESAQLRNQIAMSKVTASATAMSVAMKGAQGIINLFGGPEGLALTTLVVGWEMLNKRAAEATDVLKGDSAGMAATSVQAEHLAATLRDVAKAHGEAAPKTTEQKDADTRVSRSKEHLADQYGGIYGGGTAFNTSFTDYEKVRNQAAELTTALIGNKASATQADAALEKMAHDFPTQGEFIQRFAGDVRALEANLVNAGHRAPELAGAIKQMQNYQLPGATFDKGTQGMLDQIANQEKLIAATEKGGEIGARSAQQTAEGVKAATEWYTQWGTATKNASAAQYTLQQASALTDQQIDGLAKQANAATFGSKTWAASVGETADELVKARLAALGFGEAGKTLANDLALLEAATLHAANAYKVQNTKGEIADTLALAAAVGRGAAAYRDMEIQTKSNAAARGLAQGSTTDDRTAAGKQATLKAEADQALAIAKTNQERQIAANDAATMALADSQGVVATVAATNAVKAQHDAEAGLSTALSYNIETNERLTESQNKAVGSIDAQIVSAQRATANMLALTAAMAQGKAAVEAITIAQRVQAAVDALDLTATDKQIKSRQLLAALTAQQAAADTDAATKTATELHQSIDLLNGQTDAISHGAAALRDYNVWMAGQAAVNKLAGDTAATTAAQVRDLAEAEETARQRNQAAQSNMRTADKDKDRPLQAAYRGMENDAGQFFDTILSNGHDAFQTLWDDMTKTFIKALADMAGDAAIGGLTKILGTKLRAAFGISDPHGSGELPAGTTLPTSSGPDITPSSAAGAGAGLLTQVLSSPSQPPSQQPAGSLDATTASAFQTFGTDFHTLVNSPVGAAMNSATPAIPQAAAIRALGLNVTGAPNSATTGGNDPLAGIFGQMLAQSQRVPGSGGFLDVNPDVPVPHTTVSPQGTLGSSELPPAPVANTAMDQIPAAPPVPVSAPGMSVGQGAGVVLGAALGGFAVGNAAGHAKLGPAGDIAVGTLGGAAEGAAAGAAAGPVGMAVGAAVGAVAGLVGSITGLGDAAHQAAENLKNAQIAFNTSIDQYTASITGSNLQTKLQGFEDSAGALYAEGKKANFSPNNPNDAGLQNLENIANQTPAQRQQMYTTLEGEGKSKQQVDDEVKFAQQVVTELREAITNATADFVDGMKDSIQQINTGVGGDAGALQAAKEQEEANMASANAMTNATARQQALTLAVTLYDDQVKQIVEQQKLAIAAQASAVSQFQANLAIQTAQAQNNTGLAASEQFAAQQAQAMAQAVQQWSQTNPALIAQLAQVQALQAANYAANLAQQADDASDALKVRTATAAGAKDQADYLNLQLQQAQEMRAAISQWASTNPQLIQQLQQVQQLEMQTLLTNQQNAVTQETGSLTARALQAEGFTQQASIIQLQLQQTQELQQATEEWGQSNPGLIAQLKAVQALELQNAATALNTAEVNAAQGFKVQQYAYDYAGFGNPNAPLAGTGTTVPNLPVGQNPGQIPYSPDIPGGVSPGGAAPVGSVPVTITTPPSNASAQPPAPIVVGGVRQDGQAVNTGGVGANTPPGSTTAPATSSTGNGTAVTVPITVTAPDSAITIPYPPIVVGAATPITIAYPTFVFGPNGVPVASPANATPTAPAGAGVPAGASGTGGATPTSTNDPTGLTAAVAAWSAQNPALGAQLASVDSISKAIQSAGAKTGTSTFSAPTVSAGGGVETLQPYVPSPPSLSVAPDVPRAAPPPLPVSAAPAAGFAAAPPSAATGGASGGSAQPVSGRPIVIQTLAVTVQASDGTDISALVDQIIQEVQDRARALTGFTTDASSVWNGGAPN